MFVVCLRAPCLALALASSICQPPAANAQSSADGHAEYRDGPVRFQLLSPTAVRLEYDPRGRFVDVPSVVVINRTGPGAAWSSGRKKGWLTLSSPRLTVRYQIGTGAFTADNLRIEWRHEGQLRKWRPGQYDGGNLGGVRRSLDWTDAPPMHLAEARQALAYFQNLTDFDSELVRDLRTEENARALLPRPGLLSRNRFFFLDDSRSPLKDETAGWLVPRSAEATRDWYFFIYDDYPQIFSDITRLIGPIPMVPRFALGAAFASRLGYTHTEWQEIARRFRQEGIPLDILLHDSTSSSEVIWSGWDHDVEQLPDPEGFIGWLRDLGYKYGLNEHYEPITRADSQFDALRRVRGLPEDATTVSHDLADRAYADTYVELLQRPWVERGLSVWWIDGHAPNSMAGLDPMMWTKAVEYEGFERLTGRRPFLLSRAGAWGSHRYPGLFTGDTFAQWNTLAYQIPYTVQAGNALEAYVSNDWFTWPNLDTELYVRWLQFLALSPVTRFHSIYGLRLPWEYGETGLRQARRFLQLRYALLPYLYTCAREAHDTGLPLARGMYLQYPDQDLAYPGWIVNHGLKTPFRARRKLTPYACQYMLGPDLLVAPVFEPADDGPAARDLYLPQGEHWFDYFTGELHAGGQALPYACPLERMPLFVRAGSIIPMAPAMGFSDERPVDPLILDVYAGASDAHLSLYEDDGTTLAYRSGEFARTTVDFEAGDGGDLHVLTVQPTTGAFTAQRPTRRYEIRVHGLLEPDAVTLGDQRLQRQTADLFDTEWAWHHDAARALTTIRLLAPRSIRDVTRVALEGAGTFADFRSRSYAREFRSRVRRIRQQAKVKLAMATDLGDLMRPPQLMVVTGELESELTAALEDSRGLSSRPPDYARMASRLARAVRENPFRVERQLHDHNADTRRRAKLLAEVRFTPEEVDHLLAILYGVELPARAIWTDPDIPAASGAFLHLQAQLRYDSALLGAVEERVSFMPPDELPGWSMGAPYRTDDGYTRTDVRQISGADLRPRVFRARGSIRWDRDESLEIWRDIRHTPTR